MKKTYCVCATLVYNGSVEVEAENAEEAYDLARQELDKLDCPDDIDGFSFGELSADYPDEDQE